MSTSASRRALETERIWEQWEEVSEPLARLLRMMDSKEDWVGEIDEDSIGLLAQMVESVENAAFANALEHGENAARVGQIFAALNSSRFLRVLDMMERRQQGFMSRLTMALSGLGGDGEAFANLYYERLMLIHRSDLLSMVFAPQRCAALAESVRLIKETRDA